MRRLILLCPLLAGCVEHQPLHMVRYRNEQGEYRWRAVKMTQPLPETLSVPSLHGPDVSVPVSRLHNIKPLGWTMLIDFGRMDERTTKLYLKACQDNPKLEGEVVRLLNIKAKIVIRYKAGRMANKLGGK